LASFSDLNHDSELLPMEASVFHAAIVLPIVKWALMYGGMHNEVRTSFGLPAWVVAFVHPFARGEY
jgi:ABC-type sulfate transport system permease subunit